MKQDNPIAKAAITYNSAADFYDDPANSFWERFGRKTVERSIRDVRPDLYKAFNPWDRISDGNSLLQLLNNSGIDHAAILEEANMHPIDSPEAWWAAVLGSGYRGTIDQLSAEDLQKVRDANFKYIRDSGIRELEANVVYAICRKTS